MEYKQNAEQKTISKSLITPILWAIFSLQNMHHEIPVHTDKCIGIWKAHIAVHNTFLTLFNSCQLVISTEEYFQGQLCCMAQAPLSTVHITQTRHARSSSCLSRCKHSTHNSCKRVQHTSLSVLVGVNAQAYVWELYTKYQSYHTIKWTVNLTSHNL